MFLYTPEGHITRRSRHHARSAHHVPRAEHIVPKTKKQSNGLLSFLVAEVGFEPHDLRVMSPTSYQAALLRDMILNLPCGAGDRGRTGTILSYHGILSPGRLPVPPHRRTVTSAALAIIPHPPRIVNPFFSFYLKKFSTNYRFRCFLKIY